MMMLMIVKTAMTIIQTFFFFIFDLGKIQVSLFGNIKDLEIGSSPSTE